MPVGYHNIKAINAGMSRGARASVVAAFGCTLGVVPHMVAAITGLAALLNASDTDAALAAPHESSPHQPACG